MPFDRVEKQGAVDRKRSPVDRFGHCLVVMVATVMGSGIRSPVYGRETVLKSDSRIETDIIRRYEKLLKDYPPTSSYSSTAVKLAACLTEAADIWSAAGGAILSGVPGGGPLTLVAGQGDIPLELTVKVGGETLATRSYSTGQTIVIHDLSGQDAIMLPGIDASSVICLPVMADSNIRGVFMLWADEKENFREEDLTALSLFCHYVATLLEVDYLSDKLGESLLTDPLTGLHNRRQFERQLRQEVARSNRYKLQTSLVVFDIDSLDNYNQSCGHLLGNLALSDIASIFIRETREVDFVARIGGDEFGAILPETNRLGAVRVADRLRSKVASYPFPISDDESFTTLTVSAGVASFPSNASSEQELLEKAFAALELAKGEGANSIKLWERNLEKQR